MHELYEIALDREPSLQRPPACRDEALELAREHYLFCGDALNEVTLKELAALLIENDWWHFWWD